jgi:hypothetical protein
MPALSAASSRNVSIEGSYDDGDSDSERLRCRARRLLRAVSAVFDPRGKAAGMSCEIVTLVRERRAQQRLPFDEACIPRAPGAET